MKFHKLIIEDYGPYRGRNELDLTTSQDSPIVLFGGQNGAGKTTLFRGIQICLHGRSALGRRVSEKEYKRLIRNKFAAYPDNTAKEASIRLEFEYANLGGVDQYAVERSWRDRGKSIVENLEVKRNGQPLSDLGEDQWEDFLKELIPPGVSQLFFFDGEKIKELASAIEDDDRFEDSLFSLLGLDLVERLDADLSVYISRKLDESGVKGITKEIEELREKESDFNQRMKELKERKREINSELNRLEHEINKKELKIAQEGGSYADKREEMKERQAELQAKIENHEDQIREIVTDSYPFALAPDLCQSVVDRLRNESEQQRREAARKQVAEELDAVLDDGDALADVELDEEMIEQVASQLRTVVENRLQGDEDGDQQLLHQFSEAQRQEMFSVVDEALNEAPGQLRDTTNELESLVREQQDIEFELGRAPEEDVLTPLVEELNELTERRGALKSELDDIEQEISKMETKIGRLENQIDNKLEKKSEVEGVSDRANLASEVQEVLNDYQDRLAKKKLQQLESVLSDRYLALSNKQQFYNGIEIDKDSLNIFVRTIHDNFKPLSELSAGERQIFATSLLWALADISDRPLPFIVDTPLGRLDQAHRENMVNNFFPEAAHQVFVFSTDTEINNHHHDALGDAISQTYHLNYVEQEGYTDIQQGYFWSSSDHSSDDPVVADLEVTQ